MLGESVVGVCCDLTPGPSPLKASPVGPVRDLSFEFEFLTASSLNEIFFSKSLNTIGVIPPTDPIEFFNILLFGFYISCHYYDNRQSLLNSGFYYTVA